MKRYDEWTSPETLGANLGIRFFLVATIVATALLADLPTRQSVVAASSAPHVFLHVDSGEAAEQPATF